MGFDMHTCSIFTRSVGICVNRDRLFGSDPNSLHDMKTTRFVAEVHSLTHPRERTLGTRLLQRCTLTFAAKASTLAVEFPLFSRTCIYATSISMTASLFTRLSRAILLNKTVFNSDDLILKVIQDATGRTLRRRGCGTN